jgi:exonuclease SbcC
MIPHQLTVSNFLSYGQQPQTISFEGYSLICLSGRNGHGKSALLDAMTWALWGQARKTVSTAKPDEGLIRLGAQSMMVLFEWYVGGKLYRVRRECTMRPGNKPYVTLDVGVYDEAARQFHSMTDKTLRKTQEVLNRIIGLEYDTYINSAYLRQGNANEFSQKAPKERKKILTAILGIDAYDALQTRALERAREHSAQITVLQELLLHDEAELKSYPDVALQHALVAEELSQFALQVKESEKERVRLQAGYAQCESRMREYHAQCRAVADELGILHENRRAWGRLAHEYRSARRTLHEHKSRDEVIRELGAARHEEHQHRVRQKETMALQQELMVQEKALFAREQMVQREIAVQGGDLAQQKHAATVSYEQARHTEKQLRIQKEQLLAEQSALGMQQDEIARQMQHFLEREQQQHAFKVRFEKRKAFYTTYVPRLRWLQGQHEELIHKVALVNDESSSCPLCDQMLSAKRKQFLQEKLHKQVQSVEHQYARLKKILEHLKKLLVDDHGELKKNEEMSQVLQGLRNQHEVLSARQAHAGVRLLSVDDTLIKATAETGALATHVQKLTTQYVAYEAEAATVLAQDSQLLALRARIHECSMRIEAAREHEHEHSLIEQRIMALEQQRDSIEGNEKKKVELAHMRNQITMQRLQLQHAQRQLTEKEARLQSESILPPLHAALQEQIAQSEARYVLLMEKKEEAAQRYGQLTQARQKLEERKALVHKRTAEVARLDSAYDDCMTLAQAWSKNGVQALLIDQAIPEIEHEANALLARLSNNQSHVFIESLRDLKRGGVRETLDIKIADTMGVRPYEMFSGGEAFRIDFALRVAISKLLARRAGAALQVLIIDEGFGSQDEEGLGRLMEALYAVQDDFAKIIVVTHLPAFKENFPVHFIVEKGASGSVVTVEQRG